MNKRNLMIVVAASIALALIIGAIVFLALQTNGGEEDKEDYRYDETEQIGVAQLLSKADVEKAIEGIGEDVSGPNPSGTLHLDDLRSQDTEFKFNVDGQVVTLTVDVKVYPEGEESDEALQRDNVFRATEDEVVEGIGDEAHMYFPADDVTTGKRHYALVALEDRKVMTLNLEMPASSEVALSRTAGEQILTELGSKVDLSNIE